MTRKEEIEQAAHNYALYFPKDYVKENDYIAGSEWADKTLLDKVCEWLEDNIYDYLYINRDFNEADYKHEFIEDLRKAVKK